MNSLLKIVLALGLFVSVTPSAFAVSQCPPGQALKRIGSAQTNDAVVSTQGEEVRAIDVQCDSTACTVGLYDATTLGGATTANLVLDVGAAASTHVLIPSTGFLDAPLQFKNGIVVVDDANVASVTLLGCQLE